MQFETSSGNVYKTDNDGLDWVSVLPARTNANAIVVDPIDTQIVYVVAHHTELLKSVDGGASWTQLHLSSPDASISDLAIDPQDHLTVYAATTSGVFGSSDGGASWRILSLTLPASAIDALAVRSGSPHTLYVATQHTSSEPVGGDSDVYSTTDDGQHWQLAGRVPDIILHLTVPPGNSHHLFGISGQRVWAFGPLR